MEPHSPQFGPVLVVDDDPEVLDAYEMLLASSGLRVLTARNGEEALALAAEARVPVCLVDLRLGQEDGIQLCLDLKEQDPTVRTLIITAYPAYDSAVQALKLGIVDYLSKTESPAIIVQKVRASLEAHAEEIQNLARRSVEGTGIHLCCGHGANFEQLHQVARHHEGYRITHHADPREDRRTPDPSVSLLLLCEACAWPRGCREPDQLLQALRHDFPMARILLIQSTLDEEAKIGLLERDVRGFLPVGASAALLEEAMQVVLRDHYWISRSLTARVLARLLTGRDRTPPAPAVDCRLSPREVEILQALSSGLSNSEIGDRLFISESTVKIHTHRIFKKLNVKSRTQAVLRALELRLF